MRDLASGQILAIETDDDSAREGVPAWSRLTGHQLLTTIMAEDGLTRFYLRKK